MFLKLLLLLTESNTCTHMNALPSYFLSDERFYELCKSASCALGALYSKFIHVYAGRMTCNVFNKLYKFS